jgi:hypothetical protein
MILIFRAYGVPQTVARSSGNATGSVSENRASRSADRARRARVVLLLSVAVASAVAGGSVTARGRRGIRGTEAVDDRATVARSFSPTNG